MRPGNQQDRQLGGRLGRTEAEIGAFPVLLLPSFLPSLGPLLAKAKSFGLTNHLTACHLLWLATNQVRQSASPRFVGRRKRRSAYRSSSTARSHGISAEEEFPREKGVITPDMDIYRLYAPPRRGMNCRNYRQNMHVNLQQSPEEGSSFGVCVPRAVLKGAICARLPPPPNPLPPPGTNAASHETLESTQTTTCACAKWASLFLPSLPPTPKTRCLRGLQNPEDFGKAIYAATAANDSNSTLSVETVGTRKKRERGRCSGSRSVYQSNS